jgi:hypothetical protein
MKGNNITFHEACHDADVNNKCTIEFSEVGFQKLIESE